ncbi:cupin domain-containing protein [Brevibacillus sp. 179-C 1.1 NHS]|uniref:cupin domain-containing protein n=1 Tax=Brevibacillus sp. 179-C 1.1 NHS TaxID=3235177 RepID=UPI0039A1ABAC
MVNQERQAFSLQQLLDTQAEKGELYHEFLRVPSMSGGIYQLAAGDVDHQQPHTEDELYCVIHGCAQLRVGEEDIPVTSGSIVFVAAHVPHHFHSITEDLTVLVLFSPAEYTLKQI